MIAAIIANAIIMFIEEDVRDSEEAIVTDNSSMWFISELVFTAIFAIECVLKLLALGCRFFCDMANVFDFFLVCAGVIGIVFNILATGVSSYSSEGRLVRVAKVF